MTKRTLRFSILVAALLVFLAAPSFIRFYTDWLWFGELGYQFVLATMLRSQGSLFTIVFVGMLVWLSANLRVAVASLTDARPTYTTREGFHVSLPGRRQFSTIANAAARRESLHALCRSVARLSATRLQRAGCLLYTSPSPRDS